MHPDDDCVANGASKSQWRIDVLGRIVKPDCLIEMHSSLCDRASTASALPGSRPRLGGTPMEISRLPGGSLPPVSQAHPSDLGGNILSFLIC
jgi:hypothetical protein